MESDDSPKSKAELGLHKQNLLSKPRASKKMEGEEKKSRVKERSKHVETVVDSDDDEPIGSLFKLKRPRNPNKKAKAVAEKIEAREDRLAAEDEDFGGMDDTLASFRKKLKGPKRDVGSVTARPLPDTVDTTMSKGGAKKARSGKAGGDTRDGLDASGSLGTSSVDQKGEHLSPAEGLTDHSVKRLEDSLSVFLQKAQSDSGKKSCVNVGLKHSSRSPTLEDESSPKSECLSEVFERQSGSALSEGYKNLICGDSSNVIAVSSLHEQSKTIKNQKFDNGFPQASRYTEDNSQEVKDGHMQETYISDDKKGFVMDPCTSHKICDGNCLASGQTSSLEPQTLKNRLNICSTDKEDKAGSLVLEGLDKSKSGRGDVLENKSCKGASNDIHESVNERHLHETVDSLPCISFPHPIKIASSKPEDGLIYDVKPDNASVSPVAVREQAVISNFGLASVTATSTDAIKETTVPNLDYRITNNEATGASPPCMMADESEIYAEDAVSGPDSEPRDANLSVVQRAVRRAKRRRLEDMAYEGDVDWENLISEQRFLESDQVADNDKSIRVRDKSDSSSVSSDAENGGAAAVSAGLRVHAVSPLEKIKFKELLKRKGGLHEYLECRNKILGLWSKDVSRILPLADCGVAETTSLDASPQASLTREIYAFLDQSGYINVGIASEKEKAGRIVEHNLKLVNENNIEANRGASGTDLEDGVSFILGQFKTSKTSLEAKNGVTIDNAQSVLDNAMNKEFLTPMKIELSNVEEHEECRTDDIHQNGSIDTKLANGLVSLDVRSADHSHEVLDSSKSPFVTPDLSNDMQNIKFSYNEDRVGSHGFKYDSEDRKKIIVIGAGPAGLTAARHLQRQGFAVTILEARTRIGGRVYTDRSSLSVPVDLGASIITGVEADVATERRPDPSALICAQLGLELTVLNSDCPLYDTVTGEKVPTALDEALEAEYNSLLDDMVLLVAQKGEHSMKMSLEEGLEYVLKRQRTAKLRKDIDNNELQNEADTLHDFTDCSIDGGVSEKNCFEGEILSHLERRIMNWHFAHLEYGCAALLKEVSLPHWNQDDAYGGFGGAHCMIKGGYGNVVESLGEGLLVHLNHVVTSISYGTGTSESQCNKVKVSTLNGSEFSGDAVLITIPLGCLKAETIKFSPPLPQWKQSSIQRLGFGVLNKVILEFPEVFWDDSVDYFGATAEETERRGHCFMFWNVRKTVGSPVLIALVVGKAAIDGQSMTASDHVNHALNVLRKLFGEASVPDPVASVVTDWGRDPFSYGAYSYVAIGSSGEDYDILGRPVDNCLFFAGEATCKEHPDTVGGAMMSGLREAVRIIDIFNTGNDYTAEVEAMEAAQRQLESEKDEVSDILRRLEAVELSDALYKSSLDRARIFTREALLQDLFFSAKTTSGRLHLAKELLKLSIETLKSFAGTKRGLTTLNSWILDSMGKDGTQLLRHCVRLLVRVSTDLLAVRLSGIGKTVKEKVCVHTSRDIRAIASQLVSVWLEVFRREKASRRKSFNNPATGKPPLRIHHGTSENKGSLQAPASSGSPSQSNANVKKVNGKLIKMENIKDPKLESRSQESEEERAALAAVEAARAAARAAAEAYASSQAKSSTLLQLPKIPSFHKFARREQYAQMDEYDFKRRWSGGVLGRQDCISEIDSRNCRVRDWSLDFSAAYADHDSSRKSVDNLSQKSHSNEIASHMNFREQSGESVAVDSSLFTRAWVDTSGIKDCHAIERWQSQAAAADADFFHSTVHMKDEEDSNTSSKPPTWKNDGRVNESSISQVTVNKESLRHHAHGAHRIKQAVVDFVASLLMPVYKARKIDRDGYKSIMKKSSTKVMEQATDAEKAMAVHEFLDSKRKNKIRAFVDKLIERHMASKSAAKP